MEGKNHIFDWTKKIDPKLFSKNYPDKSERKESLRRMGLPAYKEVVVNLAEFDSDPDAFLSQVSHAGHPAENYYFTIFPNPNTQVESGLSTGKQGFSKDQMINFIEEQKINLANHTIIIEPHHEKVYSGTINIGGDGKISGEFITGREQSDLSRGKSIPEFQIEGRLVDIENGENFSYHSKEKSEKKMRLFMESIKMAAQAVRKEYRGNLPPNLDLDLELFYIASEEGQKPQPLFFDILDHSAAKEAIVSRSRFNAANWKNRTSE